MQVLCLTTSCVVMLEGWGLDSVLHHFSKGFVLDPTVFDDLTEFHKLYKVKEEYQSMIEEKGYGDKYKIYQAIE